MQTRIMTCLSARGGVGKTSIAAGLALAAAAAGYRCTLVDLDPVARALDTALACEDRVVYDLGDLLAGRREAAGVALTLREGLTLIPGAYHLARIPAERELREHLTAISERTHAELMILDTASPTDAAAMAATALSDTLLAVTTPAPRAIAATAALAASGGHEGLQLLINRHPLTARVDIREIVDTTGLPLLGIVPAHDGVDAYLVAHGTEDACGTLACAFRNILSRLAGEAIPLLSEVTPHRRAVLGI